MSRAILIADNRRDRALQLADACRAHGLEPRTVGHGSRALEVALQSPPAVLVAPSDLPLIDAAKLASILRANPRTQQVRFVFLEEQGGAGPRGEYMDEVIALPADPNDIAQRVEAIVNRQARLEDVGKASEQQGVTGELRQISLPDLIQLFHANRKSGTIQLVRRAGDREVHGTIHLDRGDVVQAATGVVEGEKALFRLLTWERGHFEFSHAVAGDRDRQIQTPTRHLLMEGMRQVDELGRLAAQLPAREAHVALRVKTAELPNTIHPLTQEVLLLLEIYGTVGEVVDRCSFPDYQVLRTLQTLADRGMVEIRREAAATPLSEAERLFSTAQARRLRDWLARLGVGGAGTHAKLLVVSPDEGATHDFVRLLRGLPGMRLEGAFAGSTFSREDLARIGQLPVDGETGLELLHVPADARYAPLWPVVAHGAVGVVFLMAGAMGPAAERIRPMAEALRALPRPRLFHVVLVRKGERSLAEELGENTRLFDEVPLFLLPLERDKDPLTLLRGLFSRVLP